MVLTTSEYPIPGTPVLPSAEKNLCRVCGVDYGTLALFDKHREHIKIVRDHGAKVCEDMIFAGTHPKGECQRVVGECRHPKGLVEFRGVWWTPEGAAKAARMSQVGRQAKSR